MGEGQPPSHTYPTHAAECLSPYTLLLYDYFLLLLKNASTTLMNTQPSASCLHQFSLCLRHLTRNSHSLLYITLITGTHKFRLQFQFVQYLLHSPLVIEVWGKQSGRKMSRRETQGMAVRNAISPSKRTSEESVGITNSVVMVRSCCFLYISHGSSFYLFSQRLS